MKVTVKLGEGSVYVGEIDIDTDGDSGEDVDQQRLRSAGVKAVEAKQKRAAARKTTKKATKKTTER